MNPLENQEETVGPDPEDNKWADWENPVFDGPQPRDKKPLKDLNTENAGE